MIPNNQTALLSSNNMLGGRSGPPPLPDNYKNNILKAKTFDENKIAEATNVGINQTNFANDRFHRYILHHDSAKENMNGYVYIKISVVISIYNISNFFFSPNLNLTGDSPPPKEIPDMSSATFVSVVSLFCRFIC